MTQAYPLQWPAGKPRTRYPERSRFGTYNNALTVENTRNKLWEELRRLGASHVVLSTNIELRKDGMPWSGRKMPDDRGVAVYFTLDREARCFACDKWETIPENIIAIRHTIEALRGIERWGGGDMVKQAFRGFEALPSPKQNWWDVMECGPHNLESVVIERYRDLAKKRHPDQGGSHESMARLNAAYDEFKKERGII